MVYEVRTSFDNRESAELFAKAVVETHAAVSVHIKEVESIHYWDGRINNMTEYEIWCLTSNVKAIKMMIGLYHNYKMPEVIYHESKCSKEIEDWITGWCKDYRQR